jgi:hypothetical protein
MDVILGRWQHKDNSKKVWIRNDGQILTNESFSCGGNHMKFFLLYANHYCRDKGINYASGDSFFSAKNKALPINDALKISGLTK